MFIYYILLINNYLLKLDINLQLNIVKRGQISHVVDNSDVFVDFEHGKIGFLNGHTPACLGVSPVSIFPLIACNYVGSCLSIDKLNYDKILINFKVQLYDNDSVVPYV